jgi:hypothetical protein
MPYYEAEVIEVTEIRYRYTVKADSVEEAEAKLLAGETVESEEYQHEGVIDRQLPDQIMGGYTNEITEVEDYADGE